MQIKEFEQKCIIELGKFINGQPENPSREQFDKLIELMNEIRLATITNEQQNINHEMQEINKELSRQQRAV